MSLMIPVDGAYTGADPVSTGAEGSFDLRFTGKYRAEGSAQVHGINVTRSATSFTAGTGQEAVSEGVLTQGSSEDVAARSVGEFEVNGPVVVRSEMALQVSNQRAALGAPSLSTFVIGSGALVASRATMGQVIKGRVTRASLFAQTLRGYNRSVAASALSTAISTNIVAQGQFSVGGKEEVKAQTSLDVRTGDTFLILVDIIPPALTNTNGTGYFQAKEITAQLKINGSNVPIKAFEYSEPAGKLGAFLNITLAIPGLYQVPMGADMEFSLVSTTRPSGVKSKRILMVGKIGGRELSISYRGGANGGPADQVTISGVNEIQDKFSLAPRRSIIMYDPVKVSITDVQTDPMNVITNEKGQPILPVLEPVYNLTMMDALRRAYTYLSGSAFSSHLLPGVLNVLRRRDQILGGSSDIGLGFNSVVTNIPNYRITRADFTIDGGWHDGVQPLIGMFGPMFFVFNNVLFILDIERKLPAGFTPYRIPINKYKSLALSRPYKDTRNAVLLTYTQDLTNVQTIYYTFRFDQPEPDKQGVFGSVGYTEITTVDEIRSAHDIFTNAVVAEVTLSHKVTTKMQFQAQDGGGGALIVVHEEIQEDRFDGNLKTGHHKVVKGVVRVGPDKSLELVELLREECNIEWVEDIQNPGTQLQYRNFTETVGLVYISTDTQEMATPNGTETVFLRYPALVAQASGVVQDDGKMDYQMIETTTETLRTVSGGQLDVSVVVLDYINNTVKRSVSAPRTGSRSESNIKNRQRHILIRDLASEGLIGPRIPISLNAGELQEALALPLAKRILFRALHSLETHRMNLAGVDYGVGKGSEIQGQLRDGTYTPTHMVIALTITGENLGQEGLHSIRETLEGIQVPT